MNALSKSSLSEIKLHDVRFSYGETVMEFRATIPGGAIAAIVGPSGSGKSTLLNLIAGFETPQSGQIKIGNEDVTSLPPASRPVSMVFQENNLFAHLSVEQNVGLGRSANLKLNQQDRATIATALERVGLKGKETANPKRFREANASASQLHARWYGRDPSYCWTKLSHRLALLCGTRCLILCGSCIRKTA